MALSTLLGLRCSEDRMEAVVHVFLLINPVKSLQRSWAGDMHWAETGWWCARVLLKAAVHHCVGAVPVLQHRDRLRAPV